MRNLATADRNGGQRMSEMEVAAIAFACVLGGALAGIALGGVLPKHHLSDETKDIVRLVTGLVATLSALVLGLLIASSKSAFDTVNQGFVESAAKVVLVDRLLAQYGAEAKDARALLRTTFAARLERLFPETGTLGAASAVLEGSSAEQAFDRKIEALAPTTDFQRSIRARVLELSYEIERSRWTALEQSGTRTPTAFLVVLVSWLTAMFASFGLFAPRNRTTVTALVIGALSVATAIFLVEEMSDPFSGVIRISSAPMRNALALLGK